MSKMKRYVFIDVPNTLQTTKQLLDFTIDWERFFTFLKNEKWECEKAFFYQGWEKSKRNERKKLKIEKIGYIVRSKDTHIHKGRCHIHECVCEECGQNIKVNITNPDNRKANCDVELTVDVMEIANTNLEEPKKIIIFTGDGDFRFLVENIIQKNVKVIIVSSTKKNKHGDKRFSSRLRDLINKEEILETRKVLFLNIDNLKKRIEKIEK